MAGCFFFTLLKYRLVAMYPGIKFKAVGEPTYVGGAHELANNRDRYQFQWWALSLVQAKPLGGREAVEGSPNRLSDSFP